MDKAFLHTVDRLTQIEGADAIFPGPVLWDSLVSKGQKTGSWKVVPELLSCSKVERERETETCAEDDQKRLRRMQHCAVFWEGREKCTHCK